MAIVYGEIWKSSLDICFLEAYNIREPLIFSTDQEGEQDEESMEQEVPRTYDPASDHWLTPECRTRRCRQCDAGSIPVDVGRIPGITHVVQIEPEFRAVIYSEDELRKAARVFEQNRRHPQPPRAMSPP
jgi:hypothetical protein